MRPHILYFNCIKEVKLEVFQREYADCLSSEKSTNCASYVVGKMCHKDRHHLANTFLSITFLASIPWMIMIVPVGLILGGIRAIFGPKPAGRPEKLAKSMPDDDSGISAAECDDSKAATTSPNSSENSVDFKEVTVRQKRDVAILTNVTSSDNSMAENRKQNSTHSNKFIFN
ncbi:hypothetical protein CRE_27847 [Caenorhabditis remanei]|uniref:Uncharacterized protein n=1 Tax=Caenorhabditis remanei TaxID=31234 RepID=E3NDL1_CAERE|nr:hypothetical protein CRE_27847 [Caenorhabditis remanei]